VKRIMRAIAILCVPMMFVGADCDGNYEGQGDTQRAEASFTEQNQARLLSATPPPVLDQSLERKQLRKRLLRFNDEHKISYLYVVSATGMPFGYFPIKGKVSSVNSKLTTGEQIVDDPFGSRSNGAQGQVVESPQLDGSYGTNGDAIFFFTTEDVYVEWNGLYFLSDEPLKLTGAPLLVRQTK